MNRFAQTLGHEFAELIPMYCVTGELARAIGRDKFLQMFFGPLPARSD